MNSEPYKLHVAIFPSLQAIKVLGGGNMLINHIEGSYSKNEWSKPVPHTSKFIQTFYDKFYIRAIISWNASKDKDGKPITIEQLLRDLAKDNIPDVMIKEITFLIPYTTYDRYTMQNQTFLKEWKFHPHPFKPGIWNRLKAENFPSKELYLRYLKIKRKLKKTLDFESYKRWRDIILINAPHPELDNNDVRSMWMGRPFALLLKETRGKFDLMDLGELKK